MYKLRKELNGSPVNDQIQRLSDMACIPFDPASNQNTLVHTRPLRATIWNAEWHVGVLLVRNVIS